MLAEQIATVHLRKVLSITVLSYSNGDTWFLSAGAVDTKQKDIVIERSTSVGNT